jgi:hypothetical protein
MNALLEFYTLLDKNLHLRLTILSSISNNNICEIILVKTGND